MDYSIGRLVLWSVQVCLALTLMPPGTEKIRYGLGNNDTSLDYGSPAPANSKQIRWAEAAFNFVVGLDCNKIFFTTERECRNLVRVSRSETNIYLADPSVFGRLRAVLPDGSLRKTGLHDAVLVVDPYPNANFGHLLIIFYIEIDVTRLWCDGEGGIYLAYQRRPNDVLSDGGDCLVLGLKRRCKNALHRRSRRRNFARRCEINFLPLVYLSSNSNKKQLLACRPNIPGFAPCPPLRPEKETSGLICNPIRENTKRCETTHETIHTSCRIFEICDQAVLLSGGWNRWTSRAYHKDNIWHMHRMLQRHGFKERNLKIFFANGADGINVSENTKHEVFPAALKHAMRLHLQKLCASAHCVDTLFFYMNSPAKSDGTSLLWDTNQDGIASEHERYSLKELLSDLSHCKARQVLLVVDQSFSGEVVRAVRRSKNHNNIVVFASSRDHEYSWGWKFTRLWTKHNHTHSCAKDVFKIAKKELRYSSPEVYAGAHSANVNIFGAPCDVKPPFTHRELRQNYLGCQNIPTAVWMRYITVAKSSQPLRLSLSHRSNRQRVRKV